MSHDGPWHVATWSAVMQSGEHRRPRHPGTCAHVAEPTVALDALACLEGQDVARTVQ